MKAFAIAGLLASALFLPVPPAQASGVTFAATLLGGNTWRYDYTVQNTSPSLTFDEISVYFDAGLYDALANPVAEGNWDPYVAQPDAGVWSEGFFDILNLDGYLAGGASTTFSLTFDYLGTGTPGAQRFDFFDSADFSVQLTGNTVLQAEPPANDVPEPASIALVLAGLGAVGLARHRMSAGAK